MIALSEFVTPILVSAAFVFVASSLIHMVIKYHNPDYRQLPNEDEVRAAIRKGSPRPAQYILPWCLHGEITNKDEIARRFNEGPVAMMWLRANGMPNMGGLLMRWFIYCGLVALFAAYLASHVVPRGAHYLAVFRVVGTVAFLGFGAGGWADVIWKGKPSSCALKDTVDSLIYAMVTAGTFGWLWPH